MLPRPYFKSHLWIFQEFSEEDYNYIINGWKDKVQRVGQGDQRWGLFMAEKPEAV